MSPTPLSELSYNSYVGMGAAVGVAVAAGMAVAAQSHHRLLCPSNSVEKRR